MGRQIVYCVSCGEKLTEDDFDRGKAQVHENRPFCGRCRPVTAPPSPPPRERVTERREQTSTRLRKPPTGGFPRVPPPPPAPQRDSRSSMLAVGAVTGLAIVVILGAFMMGGKTNPPVEMRPSPLPESHA